MTWAHTPSFLPPYRLRIVRGRGTAEVAQWDGVGDQPGRRAALLARYREITTQVDQRETLAAGQSAPLAGLPRL
jgi:hypothetical protein